jgi:peptide/nickel transport system substrate-binding protein
LISSIKTAIFALMTLVTCEGGAYRTALLGDQLNSFDPILVSEYNHLTFISQICGRLVSVDEYLNIESDLAQSWKVSDDGKTYSFILKTQRSFQTGHKITAEDVKFSFNRIINNRDSTAKSWASEIKHINIKNSSKIDFILSNKNPRFLYKISHPRFCILNKNTPFINTGKHLTPNSSGSYNIEKISQVTGIDLEVSKDYRELAIEKNINVSFLSQAEAIKKYQQGELEDLSFYLLSDKETESLESTGAAFSPKMNIYWTWLISLNPSSSLFKKKINRKNLIDSFDTASFVKTWDSDLVENRSIVPIGMRGGVNLPYKSVKKQFTATSIDRAVKISILRGLPNETTLKIALNKQFAHLPHGIEISFLEMGAWIESYTSASHDIYISGLDTNSNDSIGFFRYFISTESDNYLGYKSAAMDEIYNRLKPITYPSRSKKDYEDMQFAFESAYFGVALGNPIYRFALDPKVNKFHMNPLGMHLNRWWKIGRK